MNCAEFKEHVSALALGALEPDEESACSEHLEAEPFHQGCHEAYARALVTAGKLATSLTPVKPGAQVWAGIEAALDAEARNARPSRRWGAAVGWAVAAAAAIALVYVWLDRQKGQSELLMARGQVEAKTELANTAQQQVRACQDEVAAVRKELEDARGGDRRAEAVALSGRPGTKKLDMEGKGFRATVFYNPTERRAYVVAKGLDTGATAKNDFQLWVIRKGAKGPLPAGLMRRLPGNDAAGEVDPGVLGGGEVMAIAMSLEPKGGSLNGKPTTVLMAAPVGG
ncbi:MAG TPA: anti-sigma factor [Myxococcaceae bacterium]|nr:anti-sigma factor [Myxococcaceae bacterium]